jgi:MraZ protein
LKKHAVFLGPHDTTLDAKRRLMIPSGLKRCIDPARDGQALMAVSGDNDRIWLMTANAYLEKAEQPLELTPGKGTHDHNLLWYGGAHELPIDGNGRVLIPAELLEETKTGNSVTLVGASTHIEIWNRQEWRNKLAALKTERRKRRELEEQNAVSQTTPMPPGM